MKRTISLIIAGVLFLTLVRSQAATNTNPPAPKVDYVTLQIQIALTCLTNADNAGDIAETGSTRLNSKDIIQLLSGKLAFPLTTFTNGLGFVAPQRGPGVHPDYSNKAKLLLMQALGTNHGIAFIVVRDKGTNYIVDDYFTFTKIGFESLTNQVVQGNTFLNNPGYLATYVLDFKFDNQVNSDGGDRVAFDVSGKAKEKHGPVNFKGSEIDPDAIKNLQATVAGPGSLTEHFAVIDGTVQASGPVKESE
jgi:hypothetical protein